MNKNLLKHKMREHGINVEMLARYLSLSKNTLYSRISCKSYFRLCEILRIKRLLHLSDPELLQIFFK